MKVGSIQEHGHGVWAQTVWASDGSEHMVRVVTRGDRFLGLVKHYEVEVDGQPIPDFKHNNREAAIRAAHEYVEALP